MKLTTNKTSGRIYARLRTGNPSNPYISMTLGTSDAAEAKKKAKAANLESIEAQAQAGNLSLQAVARLSAGRKVTVTKAAEQWMAAAVARDESPATTAKNRAVMAQWMAHEPIANIPPLAVTEAHVSRFINREDPSVGFSTRLRQLSVIRVFLRFCAETGLVVGNVAGPTRMNVQHRKLSHEQLEPKKVRPFTAAEVKKIMDNTEGWWRWATAISYAAGLRLGDVAQLEHGSLTMPGHIIVHTGKRGKRVCLPLNDELTPGLSAILREIPPTESRYLFPDEAEQYEDVVNGRPKFSIYYGRILERLGIKGRSFHSLRHAAITRWDKAGFTLDQCAEYAGHSSTKTTKGYVHQ